MDPEGSTLTRLVGGDLELRTLLASLASSWKTVAPAFILTVFAILAITYTDRAVFTRHRPDLPGPKGVPIFGNMFQLAPHLKTMLKHLAVMEDQYGELFTFTIPGVGRNIVINRPEWLEHFKKRDAVGGYGKGNSILAIFREFPGPNTAVGSEDEDWRKSRKLIQPVFSTSSLEEKASRVMANVVTLAQQLLRSVAEKNIPLDFNHLSGRIAIDSLCKMVMDLDLGLLNDDPACLDKPHKLVDAVSTMSHMSSGRLYNPIWKFTELFTGERTRFNQARRDLYSTIDQIVKEHQACPSDKDLLSVLLNDSNDPVLLRDALVLLIFAGRDNNQNALAWSLHELTQNPQWMDRMREEVKRNGAQGKVVRFKDVSEYPIHLAVFHETLRLWPGVPKNARFALKDDILPAIPEIGVGPVPIYKGEYVLWSDVNMMRNTKVWGDDARTFNPARHLSPEGKFIKPSIPKFHAFGCGPRYCPGAQLAAYEFVSVWAGLLPQFDVLPVDKDPNSRTMTDALTLQMEGKFMVNIKAKE